MVETHFTTTEKYVIKHDPCTPTAICVSGGVNRVYKPVFKIIERTVRTYFFCVETLVGYGLYVSTWVQHKHCRCIYIGLFVYVRLLHTITNIYFQHKYKFISTTKLVSGGGNPLYNHRKNMQ